MKLKLLIAGVAIAFLSSCAQSTCPTYAKKDKTQKQQVESVKIEKEAHV